MKLLSFTFRLIMKFFALIILLLFIIFCLDCYKYFSMSDFAKQILEEKKYNDEYNRVWEVSKTAGKYLPIGAKKEFIEKYLVTQNFTLDYRGHVSEKNKTEIISKTSESFSGYTIYRYMLHHEEDAEILVAKYKVGDFFRDANIILYILLVDEKLFSVEGRVGFGNP